MRTKRLTLLAIMLAAGIVLSYVESMIPVFWVPGVKLGLANVITLVIMYLYGSKDALLILILRIFLVALIRGTLASPTFGMSLSGGILAYGCMFLFKQMKVFSIVGVSIMGAFGHSVGQILAAMVLLNMAEIIYYLPYILVLSIATGILTGIISRRSLDIVQKAI